MCTGLSPWKKRDGNYINSCAGLLSHSKQEAIGQLVQSTSETTCPGQEWQTQHSYPQHCCRVRTAAEDVWGLSVGKEMFHSSGCTRK